MSVSSPFERRVYVCAALGRYRGDSGLASSTETGTRGWRGPERLNKHVTPGRYFDWVLPVLYFGEEFSTGGRLETEEKEREGRVLQNGGDLSSSPGTEQVVNKEYVTEEIPTFETF